MRGSNLGSGIHLALALVGAIACDSGDGGSSASGEVSATASGGSESGGSESGGGVDFGDKTCALSLALTGDIAVTITPAEDPACATLLASGPDFEADYYLLEGPLARMELVVEGIDRGVTGDASAVTITVIDRDDRRFRASECSASITGNLADGPGDDFSQGYKVSGHGTCGAAAPLGEGSGVEIGAFSFVAVIPWAT